MLFVEGGTSERDLRDERSGPLDTGIAGDLGIARNTVRRYLNSPEAIRPKPPRASKVDPYKYYVDRRVAEGLENCVVLHRELMALGFDGG